MTTSRRVAVVGGGLAGISAALRLADGGANVALYEAAQRLGGRTYSFRRGQLAVDNGQHVFLRCCTAYRDLLDRLGVADRVRLQQRLAIPVRRPGERRTSWLRRAELPVPLHLAGALACYRPLTLAERARCGPAALALRELDPTDPALDWRTFGGWLREHGQSDRAIAALWDLIGVATLNSRADHASLALAAMVFQQGLLSDRAAADIGWPRVPLGELHGQPARDALVAAGAEIRAGAAVRALTSSRGGWLVHTDHDFRLVDAVVLAVPPAAAERLLPARAVGQRPGWAQRLGASPIINAHIVLDRRVLDLPMVAGVFTEAQWVFDRTEASGLRRTNPDGQYLAVSISAADHLVALPTAALRARILPALGALLPELSSATVLDFFVTRERRATFRPAPGSSADRPPTRTRLPGLVLAGAWTATGWPATMEGAVRSGLAAAGALLDQPFEESSQSTTAREGAPT